MINASTMLFMISGIAATMAVIISGRAATSEVKSVIPVSIIMGIDSRKYVTIPPIISGRAAIRIGKAFKIPCAKPVTSCSPASKIIGRFSISVVTI